MCRGARLPCINKQQQKVKIKMEKIYLTPEIEIVDLELKGTLLSGSDTYDPDTPPTTPTIPGDADDDDLV